MRVTVVGLGLSVGLGVAACAGPGGYIPPMSMQSQGTILINHMPEAANSLPSGALVLAPLTSVVGQLNTVPVGP